MSEDWNGEFNKEELSSWTTPLYLIYGSYEWLNEHPIHYCMTSLSVKNLWDDIRLMNEIPGVEKWGFEALFQRVISDERVLQIKSGYLGDPERFKFFPPITIALLPCLDDVPQRTYEREGDFKFEKDEKNVFSATMPGLQIRFPTSSTPDFPVYGTPASLKWDKKKYVAIAIDGQHRVSALRQFVPRESQNADKKDLPAIVLVFDPKLPAGRDLIQVTREIFIDINKNAKTVDDSRLILLDDRNFYNCLTRKLILQAYADGETPIIPEYSKLSDDVELELLDGIPQELIDTAAGRESADVNKLKGWQYTSAFILNRTIQYFAFENKFEKFEDLLESQDFSSDSEDEAEQAIAIRRQEYKDGTGEEEAVIADSDMLSFRPSITEKIVDRTLKRYKGLILGVFTSFDPFKLHIENYKRIILQEDGDLLRSVLLSEGSIPNRPEPEYKTKISTELRNNESHFRRIKKLIEKLSKPAGWSDNLVWYSVFQRGLLFQPLMLQRAMELARGTSFESREQFADRYVSSLNALYDEGWFDRNKRVNGQFVWHGISLKFGDKGDPVLDGSDSAARRTGNLIRLMVMSVISRESDGYRTIVEIVSKQGVKGARNNVVEGYTRFSKTKDSFAGSPKDDDQYLDLSRRNLDAVLKEISDDNMI